MTWTALLVLPLVGGYALSTIWEGSIYYAARESGHRLYFRAVFYGVFLIGCAALIHVYLFSNAPSYRAFVGILTDFFANGGSSTLEFRGQGSYTAILIQSFVLGPAFAYLLNLPKLLARLQFSPCVWWQHFLLQQAIKNNDFELLILKSLDTSTPMLVSLNNGKIYVGWAVRAPNPIERRRAIRVLPLMSGYRDTDHRTIFTTDYLTLLDSIDTGEDQELNHLDRQDFEIVLPVDQIVSARLFDLTAYRKFGSDTEPSPIEEASP